MKVFLCGGGADVQTIEANKRLNEVIDHSKPCLYIPLAMEEEMYDSCYEWIQGELSSVDIPGIDMVRSVKELAEKDLADYSFLFIGGGNTFKLLRDIKVSGTICYVSGEHVTMIAKDTVSINDGEDIPVKSDVYTYIIYK